MVNPDIERLQQKEQGLKTVSGISAAISTEILSDYQLEYQPDDAVYSLEKVSQDAFLETRLPGKLKESVAEVRRAFGIEEIKSEGKVSSAEYIFSRFPIKTRDAQRSGKSWKLYYRYDSEVGQLVLNTDSIIMEELSADSATEVRDVLWWSEMAERMNGALLASEIDIHFSELPSLWESRKGFVAAMRKDLPFFLAMYKNVSSSETGSEELFDEFMKTYYVRASLKRRKKEDGGEVTYTKVDPVNWKVACAVAIAQGMSESEAFSYYGTKEDSRDSVREMVKKLQGEQKGVNDLSPLYNENARIVGRIAMTQYMYARLEELVDIIPDKNARIQRVLEEAIVMMTLCLSPSDIQATALTHFVSIGTLRKVIAETYPEVR